MYSVGEETFPCSYLSRTEFLYPHLTALINPRVVPRPNRDDFRIDSFLVHRVKMNLFVSQMKYLRTASQQYRSRITGANEMSYSFVDYLIDRNIIRFQCCIRCYLSSRNNALLHNASALYQ